MGGIANAGEVKQLMDANHARISAWRCRESSGLASVGVWYSVEKPGGGTLNLGASCMGLLAADNS